MLAHMFDEGGAPVVVCIDATSLAVLQLSREGASRWAWPDSSLPDSSPLRPPGKPRPARNTALDRSRRELEAEAAAEFAEAGGGSSAASLAWRQVFVRRRLALVVSGALGALSGGFLLGRMKPCTRRRRSRARSTTTRLRS